MAKTILSLFDYSGAWSKPYRDNGYSVVQMDIDLDGNDIRLLQYADLPSDVHGILAAPPCNHLAVSGARWWEDKGPEALLEGLSLVDATLRIVTLTQPKWWVLENPVGRLVHYLGPPKMYFQPCDYGDTYTKKTCLWGNFNIDLTKNVVEATQGSRIHSMSSSWKRQRQKTPEGFAKAFYGANP